MKKQNKEKKQKEIVIQTPSKIVSVVFTIPTSFSYESVKVEISGVADNNEIVEKYSELVEMFRPKPKPAPIAIPPMKPYRVEKKEEPEVATDKQFLSKDEIEEVQKGQIRQLMSGLGYKNPVASDIYKLTELSSKEPENLPKIIEILKSLPAVGN